MAKLRLSQQSKIYEKSGKINKKSAFFVKKSHKIAFKSYSLCPHKKSKLFMCLFKKFDFRGFVRGFDWLMFYSRLSLVQHKNLKNGFDLFS